MTSRLKYRRGLLPTGHGLEHTIGYYDGPGRTYAMPIDEKLWPQMRKVYNDLNNPYLAEARARDPNVKPRDVRWGTGFTPKDHHYKGKYIPREYWAEAIRAALTNPTYMKAIAPDVWRTLETRINSDPWLRKFLMLNSVAGAAILPPLLAGEARADDAER